MVARHKRHRRPGLRTPLTDSKGQFWHPDNYFQSGVVSDPPRQVSGTPDPKLYAQERYGHFTYSIPVDGAVRAYCDAVWAFPALQEWVAAARTETLRAKFHED